MPPTLSELEADLFQAEVELGLVQKTVRALRSRIETLQRQRNEATVGLSEADKHIATMKAGTVVLASEWAMVKKLRTSLSARLEELNIDLSIAQKSLLDDLQSAEYGQKRVKDLQLAIQNFNNIIRFPNDVRRSEEEAGD